MGSNDSKYLTQIFRILAEAPLRRFGAAASQPRGCTQRGKLPTLLSLGASRSREAKVCTCGKAAWLALGLKPPPGPLGQASFQTSVSAQVRWGLSASNPATPLGLGFGFRVQTGLHSSEEANSGIIKAGEINSDSQPGRRPAVPEAATRGASSP